MNIGRIIGSVVVCTIALSVGWAFVDEHGATLASNSPDAAAGAVQATNGGTACGTVTLRKNHYFGAITPNYPYKLTGLKTFDSRAGRDPNIIPYFMPWGKSFDKLAACQTIHLGALPLISINPRHISISKIANGGYNKYLNTYGQAVKKFGHTIAFTFGHEMNGKWYGWGYSHVAPKTFVKAWRTIHKAFTNAGAKNVVWVWTVNREGPGISPVKPWWPGAGYVNWVGIDGHYINTSNSFKTIFAGTIKSVRAFTSKPILIAETAVSPDKNQPQQIANLFHNAGTDKGILGFVWFNIDARRKWHLGSDKAGLAEFRKQAAAYVRK